jgi:hypothetical protein
LYFVHTFYALNDKCLVDNNTIYINIKAHAGITYVISLNLPGPMLNSELAKFKTKMQKFTWKSDIFLEASGQFLKLQTNELNTESNIYNYIVFRYTNKWGRKYVNVETEQPTYVTIGLKISDPRDACLDCILSIHFML